MRNQFRNDLLMKLDNKYDIITYDIRANILEVTINKKLCFKDLNDIMEDLSNEIMYPMISFHSDYDKYIFTYQLMEEK